MRITEWRGRIKKPPCKGQGIALLSGWNNSTSPTGVTHLVKNAKVCYPTGYKEC